MFKWTCSKVNRLLVHVCFNSRKQLFSLFISEHSYFKYYSGNIFPSILDPLLMTICVRRKVQFYSVGLWRIKLLDNSTKKKLKTILQFHSFVIKTFHRELQSCLFVKPKIFTLTKAEGAETFHCHPISGCVLASAIVHLKCWLPATKSFRFTPVLIVTVLN